MTENKKKIVPILLSIALIGGIVVLRLNQSQNDESKQETNNKADSLFSNDPNFSLGNSDVYSNRDLVFKTIASIAIVLTLGVAAIYVSKKFTGKLGNIQGKKIKIVETTHLGQRKMLHLIKVGNQQLLIGSTNENLTMLADVTGSSNSQSFSETLDEMDFSTNQANTVNASQ
jgi:flagellar biosynthetic protein FliO